jgi:DNA-binding MarR family transcriptional regulator
VLDVSCPTLGLIDRMVERGLVERIRVPDDRRLVLVALSAHGRQCSTTRMCCGDLLETILRHLDAPS